MIAFKSARAEGEEEGDLRSDPFLKMEMFLGRPPPSPPCGPWSGEPSGSLSSWLSGAERQHLRLMKARWELITSQRSCPLHSTGDSILGHADYK